MTQKYKSQGLLSWICSLNVTFLVFLFTFITFPISGWFVLKVVPNYERIVVFHLGRIRPPEGPGVVLVLPLIDQWQKDDLRTRAFSVPTKDGGPDASTRPFAAYSSGRLRVQGDLNTAMKLETLIKLLKTM
uniref:Band 7 domain-containing protein n=1 Tax=Cyprinus carpio TaxID=7962 RepID=A0A8C2L1D3_CYPCA